MYYSIYDWSEETENSKKWHCFFKITPETTEQLSLIVQGGILVGTLVINKISGLRDIYMHMLLFIKRYNDSKNY